MKKIFILLFSVWLLTLSSLANVSKLPERTVENVADGVIVTYKFENPIIRPNHLAPGSYLWEYMGFGVNDTPGEPAIPYRSDMFYIPAGYKAQITLLDSTYRDTTIVLSPAIPAVSNNGSTIVSIDSITPYTGLYPNSVLKYGPTSKYREVGLQRVTIIPLKYNYSQHKVRAYSEIKYKVSFVQDGVSSDSKGNIYSGISDLTSKFLTNTTLNYISANPRSDSIWHSVPDKQNYLILTTNEYNDAIQDFVKWKLQKGNDVIVESKPKATWAAGGPESVKIAVIFWQSIMELDGKSLDYVLIVGGNDDVPGMPFDFSFKDEVYHAVTDFYYGLPDTDSIPQIYRGRITGDNSSEISTVLNKIIQYEKNPPMDESFYTTALHCSYFEDYNHKNFSEDGYEDGTFVLTSENIRNHLVDKGYHIPRQYAKGSPYTTLYWSDVFSDGVPLPADLQPGTFLLNGNADSIRNIINNGTFYVFYHGHGETEFWQNPFFSYYDISSLQNGNKLPVIFSMTCLTGKYNLPYDCFAEKALKKSDGGCVGIFASTDIGITGYSDAVAMGMFDAIWPNLQLTYFITNYYPYQYTSFSIPTYELGQILDRGLLRMGETNNWDESNKNDIYKLYHCFGDPSMRIYTDKPKHFAEPSIFSRNDTIYVFVEDGDCKITFLNKLTNRMESYIGNYAAYANPADSLVICLDRHNYVPYIWDYSKDLFIQNENIQNETRIYKGNAIYIGNNVTSTKPTGDVNIQSSNITIQGKRLELRPGTRIDKNFKFQNR